MPKPPPLRDALLETFARLGVESPEDWVDSQLEEGIPQLHRAAFLAKAWTVIPDERSEAWMEQLVDSYRRDPEAPYAGAGKAIASLRAKGATAMELTDLVRAMQAELLFHISYLLSDPGYAPDERFEHPLLEATRWALVTLDEQNQTGELIDGLHESVLETDPMGREVRPIE
ncbi:MAG: hypothetical protein GXP55_26495 [Deltaproteobacteria bacterium]|nr:hypothetical protein [Deltaproteobacteria bacterium]